MKQMMKATALLALLLAVSACNKVSGDQQVFRNYDYTIAYDDNSGNYQAPVGSGLNMGRY